MSISHAVWPFRFDRNHRLVIVMIAIMSAIPAVILMIPVAFVQLPTLAVVIVMGMTPICPFIGRTVPAPCHPPIVAPMRSPVPIDPGVAGTWKCPTPLVTNRRWCAPDVHPNLGRSRNRENGREQYAIDPIQLHFCILRIEKCGRSSKGLLPHLGDLVFRTLSARTGTGLFHIAEADRNRHTVSVSANHVSCADAHQTYFLSSLSSATWAW